MIKHLIQNNGYVQVKKLKIRLLEFHSRSDHQTEGVLKIIGNAKVLRSTKASKKNCNWRVKPNCPLDGACLTRNLVYKVTVFPESKELNTYIGMTEGEFKTRFRNHKQSFNNKKYALSTALSKYIWELK